MRLSVRVASLDSFWQLIGILLIFVLVLVLTYFTTRWIAGYQKNQGHHRNLRILETIRLSNNKYIQIVEAGEEYLVIAVGREEIHLLTKLTREQLSVLPEQSMDGEAAKLPENFQEVWEKLRNHLPKNGRKK